MQSRIKALIEEQGLPDSFHDLVENHYQPLAVLMARRCEQRRQMNAGTWLVGLQGTQGSGKSTCALFLKEILEKDFQFRVVVLSIDDFYLTRAERLILSANVHPLLKTRGVPGTHDLPLLQRTLDQLSKLNAHEFFRIPRFDKAIDDRKPKADWDEIEGPVDIVILEGWCVGIDPQETDQLGKPINELEAQEDQDGTWRQYVNDKLQGSYKALYDQLEYLIVLQAPSFNCVHEWRLLQENKLRNRLQSKDSTSKKQTLMSAEQISRFIAHYQRLTEQALAKLADKADWTMYLGLDHDIIKSVAKDR